MHILAEQTLRQNHPLVWQGLKGRIACGTGWFVVLDYLSYRIAQLDGGLKEPLELRQVKEKSGELRFYFDTVTPSQLWLVRFCMDLSRTVCEICGDAGEWKPGLDGWRQTRCDKHVDQRPSDDDPLPPIVAALVPGCQEQIQAPAGAWRTNPPLARLSRVRLPRLAEEVTANQERLTRELEVLARPGMLSEQHAALLTISLAALQLAFDSEEFHDKLAARTSQALAASPDVQQAAHAIFRSWDRKIFW